MVLDIVPAATLIFSILKLSFLYFHQYKMYNKAKKVEISSSRNAKITFNIHFS